MIMLIMYVLLCTWCRRSSPSLYHIILQYAISCYMLSYYIRYSMCQSSYHVISYVIIV